MKRIVMKVSGREDVRYIGKDTPYCYFVQLTCGDTGLGK